MFDGTREVLPGAVCPENELIARQFTIYVVIS